MMNKTRMNYHQRDNHMVMLLILKILLKKKVDMVNLIIRVQLLEILLRIDYLNSKINNNYNKLNMLKGILYFKLENFTVRTLGSFFRNTG